MSNQPMTQDMVSTVARAIGAKRDHNKAYQYLDGSRDNYPSFAELRLDAQAAIEATGVVELQECLAALVEAIDAPRYGDDSIWNDLDGYSYSNKPGPLERARLALTQLAKGNIND